MKTGLVRWEWHSLDHVSATESEEETPKTDTPWDWFHLNSIDPEPDGDIFISARSTWAGYQLEGGSGRILWRLGGLASSFKMGPGTEVAWQHDGRMLQDGEVTFFDDGSNPPIHSQSRAVRIALNFHTHEARLVVAYTHPDPPLLASSQGNMQTLADGNILVGYGGVPAISEYAKDGSLLFDAHQPYDMAFYRAFRFPWSGQPASPPALIASLNDTSEETIVHASWNGATDVAAWRVLAGNSPGSLSAQATIPAVGFESSTTLPKRYASVAVQALGSSGQVLATSKAVRVISYADSLPEPAEGGMTLSTRFRVVLVDRRGRGGSARGLLGRASSPPLPPQPATATLLAKTARSVSMAVSGVLFMGRAPRVIRGLGRPPYQAPPCAKRS